MPKTNGRGAKLRNLPEMKSDEMVVETLLLALYMFQMMPELCIRSFV